MSKKEFSVLFDTPEYTQVAGDIEAVFDLLKEKFKQDFDKRHQNASEISMEDLELYTEEMQVFDLVKNMTVAIATQLDNMAERQAEIFAMIASDNKDEE